jgi:hypothetical protein
MGVGCTVGGGSKDARNWRPLQIDLREAPVLNATGRMRVATMLTFFQTPANVLKIDYDNIVTDENMRKVLKYQIPSSKVWYYRKGQTMARKTGSEVAATPRAKTSGTALGLKKSVKPKADTSQSKKVAKPTINPRPGDRTPAVLAKVPVPGSRSTDASGKEVPTTSSPTAPPKFAKLAEDSAKASRMEVPPALPKNQSAGVAPAPDSNVIEIGDEPEEPGKKDSSVWSASKHKGKEKVQWAPKRTRFDTDPTEYALTRASEAELLFGRPCFILPTISVTQEVSAKPNLPDSSTSAAPITAEPLGQSPIGDTKAILEPEAGLVSGDQPPAETEASPELMDGLGIGDRMVMEPEGHLESGAADLLDPIREGLDQNLVMDPPRAEGLEEPRPEAQNPSPDCG